MRLQSCNFYFEEFSFAAEPWHQTLVITSTSHQIQYRHSQFVCGNSDLAKLLDWLNRNVSLSFFASQNENKKMRLI